MHILDMPVTLTQRRTKKRERLVARLSSLASDPGHPPTVMPSFDTCQVDRAITTVNFKFSHRRNFDPVINFPGQTNQRLGKILGDLLEKLLIVSTGRQDANVIDIFINNEVIDCRQTI